MMWASIYVRAVLLPGSIEGSAFKMLAALMDLVVSAVSDARFSFSVCFKGVGLIEEEE